MQTTILIILFCHYIADFVFQSRWMGENKSSSMKPLLAHISVYTLVFGVLCCLFLDFPLDQIIQYAILNGFLHMFVDYWTSRGTKYAFKNGKMHMFWCIIGFDQFLHALCLISTIAFV